MSEERDNEETAELPFDLHVVLDWLEAAVVDRTMLYELSEEDRQRLLMLAGRLSHPQKGELRTLRKALAKKENTRIKKAADDVLSRSGIRRLRRALTYATPPLLPVGAEPEADSSPGHVEGRKCYVCKVAFGEIHHFYDQMCPKCAELNWERRHQTADLTGRVALITGARVKIGYHAAIKLLRANARVIVTTRFPRDAAARFSKEDDFAVWGSRLSIYGLDLRHTPSVEAFCAHLDRTLDRLDYIINNACQTVRRPNAFYRHLVDEERRAAHELPASTREVLAGHEVLHGNESLVHERGGAPRVLDPVAMSQVPVTEEDFADLSLFPEGKLDADLQQVDLRGRNSWRLHLDEVSTAELLEVQLVNAVAPYVLNGRLRGLMNRVPEGTKKTRDKHIVNVSAMEGQFYRAFKTDRHPHTNMAKAALNMMTRTAAADYILDGIHMNSVDTGWVTDEDPVELAEKKVEEHGFHPPLDIVDGAARIVDPIFHGMLTGTHRYGQFLKDYEETAW